MAKDKQRRGGDSKYAADKYMPPEINWERHGEELFARLSEGVPVHELIHELTVDTASRSLSDVRKNLALRLITVCRNCGKLNELIAAWRIDEQCVLEGSYWFALAMLEGCHTLLLGTSGERPTWLNSVSRLVSALSAYAAEGYLRTGPQNVRLHGPYARHLHRRCEELEAALTGHQTPGEFASDPARALSEVRATKAKTLPGWPNSNSKRDKTAPVIRAKVLLHAPTVVNCDGQPFLSRKTARRGVC
jgi:hypothetical protein